MKRRRPRAARERTKWIKTPNSRRELNTKS